MMGPENTRGIGRYIQELVTAMLEVAPENEYMLITRTAKHALAGSVQTIVADIPWYRLAEQTKMPGVLRSIKADVIHVPHWNVPLFYKSEIPLVVTIHDLLLRHQPASAKSSTRPWPIRNLHHFYYKLVLQHAINTASLICVPTEYTKKDIKNLYRLAANKIVVTGEGITSLNSFSATRAIKRESSPYFLYIGSAYPHKRLDLLMEAWQELSKQIPGTQLMIAGEDDVFMERVRLEAKRSKLENIKFLGKVTDEALAHLYQGALALVFPSSFEGFGLTPVEALAAGCPVVSSDSTCLPEVLGKKGVVYFKSGSKDGMIKAVKTVVDNQDKYRNEAAEGGRELTLRHSWKQAAIKTLETYHAAVLG